MVWFTLLVAGTIAAQDLRLPLTPLSTRFAVIGDSGTGARRQYEVADQMAAYRKVFPFEFAIMLGDNIYGRDRPQDLWRKFEAPYKALLDGGVSFYASRGNHDNAKVQTAYKPFHMNGSRYYTFTKDSVQFFVLDSTYMDPQQRVWLRDELRRSTARWRISYFHHPLYSSGARHGSQIDLRLLLEPIFVEFGVNVVFSGHDHFYERVRPQQGIVYFVSGAAGQLRRRNIRPTPFSATGFDTDCHFMLVEIAGDELHFQAISRTGETVDSGVIPRSVGRMPSPKSSHPGYDLFLRPALR